MEQTANQTEGLSATNLEFMGIGPISIRVEPGQIACVSGPSGAGKSLFLRVLADLDPHKGSVSLRGTSSVDLPAPEWRRRIGFLQAESLWWRDFVKSHASNWDYVVLQKLGFKSDVLNWEVSRLSTGEKQRLALARLLANSPEALLLDEPTASLDHENTIKAEKLLTELIREKSLPVVWVSHSDEQIKRVASRSFRLSRTGLEQVIEQ